MGDYRPGAGNTWFVDVNAGLERGGVLKWTFRTLDPLTEDLPEEAMAGFLPPNDATHRGEGYVSFRITPKVGTPQGALVKNKASIVFDTQPPMDTNEVSNKIGIVMHADVDVSGSVDAVDVQMTVNAVLGIQVPYSYDVNRDGATNAVDVQSVVNAVLGIM